MIGIVFIFGLVIGSFLNVCIYRLPQGQSVINPSSYCPLCKKNIPWYDNIPLLSYLFLRGKCRFCKGKISFRYFFVELLTACLFSLLFLFFGLTYNFIMYLFFICGLIVATFADIKLRIIPDEISVGGIVMGFLLSSAKGVAFKPFAFSSRPLWDSLFGIIVGGGIIYLTGELFDLVYFGLLKKPPIDGEKESMGGGDVKLLAMIGAFLGWKAALLTFFIAPFFGSVVGIVNLIAKKEHTIPYGPFLSLGALFSLLWGNQIIRLIIR